MRKAQRFSLFGSPWQVTMLLTLLYLMGTVDRQMSALLVTPIKQDLGLSDVQVSLIQGLAFALAYAIASIPIGWMVDRYSRRAILFGGTLVWGAAATASGFASSFGQLFLARTGVGAGEATLHPSSFSIMADLFRPERLALPMTIFTLGGTIGSGLSFIVGGGIVDWVEGAASDWPLLAGFSGWQIAFILTGLPALLLGILAIMIREPTRQQSHILANFGRPGYGMLWHYARRHLSFYVLHIMGFATSMGFVVGLVAWNAAYFGRIHGWAIGEIGFWLGTTQIAAGLLGLAVHGMIVDRWFGTGQWDAHMRYFMLMSLLAAPLGWAAYAVDDPWLTLFLFNAAYFCVMAYPGVGPASLQIATPGPLRGKASAIYLIFGNLVGAIGGPLVVAMMTDYLFGDEAALGRSMSLFALVCGLAGAALFGLGMKPMRRIVAERMSESGPVIATSS